MRGMAPPFCPCQVCEWIHGRDPKHVIREARRVITLDDGTGDPVGMALCIEHRNIMNCVLAGREAIQEVIQ